MLQPLGVKTYDITGSVLSTRLGEAERRWKRCNTAEEGPRGRDCRSTEGHTSETCTDKRKLRGFQRIIFIWDAVYSNLSKVALNKYIFKMLLLSKTFM